MAINPATLFQVRLPAEMRSDVFIFGEPEENDYRRLHLAVFIDSDSGGSPLLIHANSVDRKVSFWPLDKFSQYPRYEKLYAVKRLKKPK